MPEGGDVAAFASALNDRLKGVAVVVTWTDRPPGSANSFGKDGLDATVVGVRSFGKRFFVDLVASDLSRLRVEGHFGLKGSAWISREKGPRQLLLRHGRGESSLVAALTFLEVDGTNTRVELWSGLGARYDLKRLETAFDPEAPDGSADLLGDSSRLESRWTEACVRHPKRSVEALLTDQSIVAGAGRKLRDAAFRNVGLAGKEKAGSLSSQTRSDVLRALCKAAEKERDDRAILLRQAFWPRYDPQ